MDTRDCAIIPAYNEEKTISIIVKKVKDLDIVPVVIDDHSYDKTSEFAKKSGAIVIRQRSNLGKGEAIKVGISHIFSNMSDVGNIVFIDADMQYDPEDCKAVLEPLRNGDADIVMGYRDWSTVPLRHRLGNFVWRTVFNILFGTKMKDTNCGLMAMTKEAAMTVKDSLYGGYIIENAILIESVKNGLTIYQVPVTVSYNHKSNVARGLRMVGGISLFIFKEGIKYRLGNK